MLRKRIGAVILAAGDSARMGRCKALLKLDGLTFLEHVVRIAEGAGLDPMAVVAGRDAGTIAGSLPSLAPRLVRNPSPELGQLHSLRLGIAALGEVDAAVVFLVDHPLVRVETVEALRESRVRTGKAVAVPVFGGRRGHPVLFGREAFAPLFEAPLEEGARAVLRAHPEWVEEVEVHDGAIHTDVDTPEAYASLRGVSSG